MHPYVWILAVILLWSIWQITSAVLTNHPITNYPPKGHRVVALGDSLIVGIGAGSPEGGFIPVLEKRLDTAIVNKGVSGDTTRDGLMRLENDVLNENPDIVIVLLGGNDYLRQIPEEETFANLRTIISQTQSHGAVVMLLGVHGGLLVDHFDDNFAALAKETGSLFVPNVLDGIIDNKTLMSDEIHPNDRGYEKIVDKIAPSLLGLILAAPEVVKEQ